MNILFCNLLNQENWTVHAREVLRGLSNLGHNVVLLRGQIAQNGAGTAVKRSTSLSTDLKWKLLRLRLVTRFRGEINILLLAIKEIYIFLLVFFAIVRHRGRFDIIYRRHYLFNSEYLLAKLFKIPSVKEVNGIVVDETRLTVHADRISLRIIDRIERFYMPKADKIIAVTSRLRETLQQDYGVPEDKIVVIPNGANTDLFKPMDTIEARRELGLSQSGNYVGFVGTLIEWQGIEYLIRSVPLVLEQCPNTRFLIVGDGQMKQELIELAEQVGISAKVIFIGMVPYQKVPLYINASDVCVIPKRPLSSGYSPLKLYEYMACAKPVIATRIDGFEILEQCNAGLLVSSEDQRQLTGAITTLLKNKELRVELGENGRKYVVENQSWASVAQRVAEVCQQAVKGKG